MTALAFGVMVCAGSASSAVNVGITHCVEPPETVSPSQHMVDVPLVIASMHVDTVVAELLAEQPVL